MNCSNYRTVPNYQSFGGIKPIARYHPDSEYIESQSISIFYSIRERAREREVRHPRLGWWEVVGVVVQLSALTHL